ncbi:type I inositol polyphosphate 5-phosphatase 1-like isoform X1 [Telopea speciosissima]|uniref:type I inositol polyphosphate 5-phosphatase 1-like isoform X1 n=1 Tax=Telopea speciosissima TaxID=54955 RepID=UPI001CC509FE|nr:type I inositol polyphosphate 5-phosphatase 1-like isoform X1 [Telopea speciosissima]
MKQPRRKQPEWTWVEILCFGCTCLQLFWPRIILKKWLNISSRESDYSADPDEGDSGSDFDDDGVCRWGRDSSFGDQKGQCSGASETLPKLRRRHSETLRAQYINTKELRICVGTWNVGGKLPPDDLDVSDWLKTDEPADMYVIGLQEIVPLNAGNIFGAEDNRPVPKWENVIRETLNRFRPEKQKYKCYSDPPSPSRFKQSEDVPDIEDEILAESDSDRDEEIYPLDDEFNGSHEIKDPATTSENAFVRSEASNSSENSDIVSSKVQDSQRQFSSPKRFDRLNLFQTEDSMDNAGTSSPQQNGILSKTLSGTERIGLSWPEPPMDLLTKHVLERPNSFKSVKAFKASHSFMTSTCGDYRGASETALLTNIDLETIVRRKRSPFVRIVSKQMVGIFLSIWVRRCLRRHIQNVKVSTVGVGVMGYIGNKGSVSVSMSIYQTLFCFICSHLTSGEKEGDKHKRNADVQEIHRRTQFNPVSAIGFPKTIVDHERIIWFGDLNYRINLSYERTRELISKKEWSQLIEKDQLMKELRKGRVFDGWSEGTLNFPPTYKYEFNSEKYYGEDPKAGRRSPAWCDRVLSFGNGMRLLNYKRVEQMLSDHRPVTAIYMAEVEVCCHRKLQRALTFTDAELEDEVIADMELDVGMNRQRVGEGISVWER